MKGPSEQHSPGLVIQLKALFAKKKKKTPVVQLWGHSLGAWLLGLCHPALALSASFSAAAQLTSLYSESRQTWYLHMHNVTGEIRAESTQRTNAAHISSAEDGCHPSHSGCPIGFHRQQWKQTGEREYPGCRDHHTCIFAAAFRTISPSCS